MEFDQTYFEDLIVRYFSNELNPEEIQILSGLINSSPENKKLFADYTKTWQLLGQDLIERSIDVNEEWDKFYTSKEERSFEEIESDFMNKTPVRNMNYLSYARIAAILIVIALSSVWIFKYLNQPEEKTLMASNKAIEANLPDGSHVTLNNGSTLKFPSKFKEDKRQVILQGEAYFDVTHDEEHPFLITSGNISIEVLGTSFYVNTSNESGNIEVVLTSGKVAVYYSDKPENKVILNPGERTEITPNVQSITKTVNTDENYMAWKTKKIVFNDQPLSQIVEQLNNIYHSNITISQPNLGDCRMTVTFDNQNLSAVLNVIEATLDVRIHKKGNTFELSGQGCVEGNKIK